MSRDRPRVSWDRPVLTVSLSTEPVEGWWAGQRHLVRYVCCALHMCCHGASGAQTILFTTDEEVLMRVALHDDMFYEEVGVVKDMEAVNRPITADRTDDTEVPPATEATSHSLSPATDALIGQGMKSSPSTCHSIFGTVIHLQILATWGSHDNVGLTGLELVPMDNRAVRASISSSVEEDEDVFR